MNHVRRDLQEVAYESVVWQMPVGVASSSYPVNTPRIDLERMDREYRRRQAEKQE